MVVHCRVADLIAEILVHPIVWKRRIMLLNHSDNGDIDNYICYRLLYDQECTLESVAIVHRAKLRLCLVLQLFAPITAITSAQPSHTTCQRCRPRLSSSRTSTSTGHCQCARGATHSGKKCGRVVPTHASGHGVDRGANHATDCARSVSPNTTKGTARARPARAWSSR